MLIRTIRYQIFFFVAYCITYCSSDCFYEGEAYAEGKSWNSSCNLCSCYSNSVSCTKTVCSAISCQHGEMLSLPPTECCPRCLSHKRPCTENSTNHLHNDIWPSDSKCIFYYCQDGSSVPFVIQCPSLVCSKEETLFTVPGECCPKCVTAKCDAQNTNQNGKDDGLISGCFRNINFTRSCDKKSNLREDLEVFWKNPCLFCITENSNEDCYSQKCLSCSSYSHEFINDSCCPCSDKACDKDCFECLDSDPSHCIYCADSKEAILNGKCIKECPKGFYLDENMHCQSCPSSCIICFGNMPSQCSGCQNGYLLQKGRCLVQCDPNFYEHQGHCYECHKSCSSCIGPTEDDCVACALSGQLLQDGKCVDDCDGHFYVLDGYCLACNETCIRCLKDGTCQFCEQGFYLEDGFCLPECSPGYYTFLDAYCLECHEECQGCFGPLAYQCTSCPFGQFLLQNSCVWDCGQGYFGDLGAGVCRPCHSKCRACLGGASDDKCLSCSSGYLLPYIGTHFGSCVEKCPDQYYLMESGVCGTCFKDCETCFGPNDTECTSCNNTLFLKNGVCVPHCSSGFFQEAGICYACHPSCATCYGFSETECLTCPPGRTLKHGKCVSLCGEGKYMTPDGSCSDCHSSCSDCLPVFGEDKSLQCIKCTNQQQSIFKDECIEECPSHYYLNSYHTCIECHASCATCEKSGATSCASCWDKNFLTHEGTCEAQCHQGYYPSHGICQSCSYNCHDCIDASECLQCKGDLVLQFGGCVPECAEHHYVDTVTRLCKECSRECHSCRGPTPSDCTSCVRGKLFEGGLCMNHCSDGFFQDESICKTCDLKCRTCSILNKCTSCDLPLSLLKNECVDDCGAGYYHDSKSLTCQACSFGCATCVSSGECGLCFTGYYLLNFQCIAHCPPDHYGDPVRRICRKNIAAPSLNSNSILKFYPERRILISASFLSASDADSDILLITVSHQPKNGFLLRISEKGEELHLSVGDNFTSTQLKDGWIFFKHLKGIPLEGEVALTISDGHLIGNEINLPLHVSSAFSPTIDQISNIVLTEGSLLILNSSFFSIKDPDNLGDVFLRVIQSPCSGKLVLLPDEKEVVSVSYDEFLQNRFSIRTFKNIVKYDDRFILQISDGFNSVVTEVQVFILPQGHNELFFLRNNPLLVKFDELTKVSIEHLLAVGEGLSPNKTVFSVEKSAVSSFGNFYKNINNSKQKKHKVTNGKIIFSQEDINQGLISYRHVDNSTSSLVLNMEATNTISQKVLHFDFEIQVFKQDDIIVPPEMDNQFGMMVLQNHPATITSDHLQMQLNGIPSSDIIYMITKKLLKDEGFLESLDNPGYRLQSFTQKDIDNLKIVYHPPPYADASEAHYVFQFIVLDAKRGTQLSPIQNFTITLRPQSTEFTSPSSTIDYETMIMVPQGQSVEFEPNWLSTVGHAIPEDQLEVVLTTAPQHGMLILKQNGNEAVIGEDDSFSFTSIIYDAYYTHDGSDKFKDYAVFNIIGGPYSSLNRINFKILSNDRESPVILESTTLMGSVTEGEYLDLNRRHLAYTDLISGDPDIMFTLINEPKYGKLEKQIHLAYQSLKYGDTFTQQDINDLLIRYSANSGTGDEAVRDFLYFDVSDGSGNVQSNQVLTMKVKPTIREPPVVRVTSDVKVNEGGEAIIEPHVITVFDPDSPLSDLIAVIEKQPDYGFLENSKPIPNTEKILDGIPISSFFYIDLVEGYIKYIQISQRGVEPDRDAFYIRIKDGHSSSPPHRVNVTIRPINDEVPFVTTQHLSVLQGGYAKILNSTLAVVDEDNSSDQLYISLDYPPQRGQIRLMESNNYNFKSSKLLTSQDTFSFQDVMNGLIMYVHQDSKSHENDTVSFSISDGDHTVSATINISIIVGDREVPYLLRNLGLEIMPGDSSIINNKTLNAHDSDSAVKLLQYMLTSDPASGELFLMHNGKTEKLSSDPKIARLGYFIQDDIDEGKLFYRHYIGDPLGLHHFKFVVKDPANNTLLDQKFFISISEDLFPPIITKNTGLSIEEKGSACIDSSMLSALDEHQKDKDLLFSLSTFPMHGYLEFKNDTGKPISSFLMSDLKTGRVCYLHKSSIFSSEDGFSFTVSDGKNYILQTFNINITSPYNTAPVVKIHTLSVQEGSRKTISEFEIDIFDRDSSDADLLISVISPPSHGTLLSSNGIPQNQISAEDIKHGRISYLHDDSDTTFDNFSFVLSDGTNKQFIFIDKDGKNFTSSYPVVFPIKIFPIDDVSPVIVRNEGLQVLRKDFGKIWNFISENMLYTEDSDTKDDDILYRITLQPRFGFLELSSKPNMKIMHFTQNDINRGELQYILKNDDFRSTKDQFIFSVEDTKPNKILNNIFVINWTRIHFSSSLYNVSESKGLLELAVNRIGNRNLDFTAFCKIEKMYSHQRTDDSIVSVLDEMHFKENDERKFCIFKVIDNAVFEGKREFKVHLKSEFTLMASPRIADIYIADEEDEPILSFKEGIFHVNETDEYLSFPIVRIGDLKQELSVLCITSDVTALGSNASSLQSGSDYRSRDSSHHSFITFNSGVSEMMCNVKVIDDNLYEEEEEFLLILSNPHPVGKIQNNTQARVVIHGPNDVPYVFIKEQLYEIYIGEENSSVAIMRQGVDFSKMCTVWCGSIHSTSSNKLLNSYHQIIFHPFETLSTCPIKTDVPEQKGSDIHNTLTVSLDSPSGCLLGEPNEITVTLKKKIIRPVIEFAVSHLTIRENASRVQIPVYRTGDLSSSATLHCITVDITAHARKDFEERYKTRKNSLLHFSPGQMELFCSVILYDDDTYEATETFKVQLLSLDDENEMVTIGDKNSIIVEIVDPEDVTTIEFEKPHYLVTESSFPNSSSSVILSVVRHGDTSLLSKVRISTIDGSASSGLDYYAKSKLFSFRRGEKTKNFEIEILYNRRRNWALSFTVILGPDEVLNAEIGNRSKAIVTIPRVHSTESLILPTVPVVVSLIHFDDVEKGMKQDAKSGYPLVCITPCDVNYPDYALTSGLCRESGISSSSLSYSWEIAMPLNSEENMSPYEKIVDSTLFTSSYDKVLDSIYFRPHEKVRCVAQPKDSKGHLGIPLRSKPIRISSESGFCLAPNKMLYSPFSLSSQPFIATLDYINSSHAHHPNKLHIHVEIPHEDGLLPLISTYPLHNIEFLLMQNVYRQQHVCSNLLQSIPSGKSFLRSFHPHLNDVKGAFPYNPGQSSKEMMLIYQHLDLKKCKWSFDAWYSMSDLVDLCGGTVVSDFKARDTDRTYISVLLPFFVTYIFSAAPTGWISVEHRTEIEFSFFYDTFLWKTGFHSDDSLKASFSVVRIGTDSSGHLFFEFKTVAKFYGCFVLEHHTIPGIKSHLTVPTGLDVKFNLELVWSEQTFDGPTQFWKATSNYNLKDYSGHYTVHLIPCEVSHTEQFLMHSNHQFLPCVAQAPHKFDLPITFQQTLRPEPVTYALETFFQLFNEASLFMLNPFENSPNFQYTEYKGAFSKGNKVYGRVFWSPEQELESAYQLKINEVLLCTGKNGYVPIYDPTGKKHGKGPQYGCLIPNRNLKHKFILLDKHNPEATNAVYQGLPFNAKFIEDSTEYTKLSEVAGADGFVFNIDPLYEVSSSHQWFLQVTYSIKPTHSSRNRRSLEGSNIILTNENRTNIKIITLKVDDQSHQQIVQEQPTHPVILGAHYVMYMASAILIALGIIIWRFKRPKSSKCKSTRVFDKYYSWMSLNRNRTKCYEVQCKQKIKQTEKCKIRVYTPRKEITYLSDNASETEV